MKQRLKSLFRLEDGGVLLSVLSLIIAIIISGIIMAIAGHNPFTAFRAIAIGAFGSQRAIANTFTQATPLIFTGLAFVFARKAFVINLGVEGQMYMGALGAALVGLMDLGLPAFIHLPLAILGGILFGALYAGFAGFLKVRFGSNEVVATVMLNSIALLFIGYLTNGPLLAAGSAAAQTERVLETALLPRILPPNQLTYAIFFAILACIFMKWFTDRTTIGYEIRAVGLNKKAAETAGISTGKVIFITLCISGAIAGFAGASQVLGVDRRLIMGFSPGFGFAGIAVSALAANNLLGVIPAGIVFGAMRAGSMELARTTSIPAEFSDIIQAMVVLLVASPLLVREILKVNQVAKKGGRKLWKLSSKTSSPS
ncbi:MAG: ABC transporter permease [Oscillospiraceae bacterium]|nr:ABC transporter permease [Oscillospiraceae bacterium]